MVVSSQSVFAIYYRYYAKDDYSDDLSVVVRVE